jgi:peptidase M28-like protein
MSSRRRSALGWTLALLVTATAVTKGTDAGAGSITSAELREWLSYIASDALQGRAVFSSGIGLAAAYIEQHLRAWGVKPAGDPGSYLQTVRVLGVRTTSRATVTVDVAGDRRTFADGAGVRFPRNMGGRQRLTVDRIEFAGYGLDAPAANHVDFRGKNVAGAVVVWLGASGPKEIDASGVRRLLSARNRYAIDTLGAAAAIGVASGGARRGGPEADAARRGDPATASDFTTVQRLDTPVAPAVTAEDAFFEFLFKDAPVRYDDLRRRAAAGEALPAFRLDGVRITFDVDADYQIVRTRLAHNVVGVIDGTDAALRGTYVAFGAHYDHVGYAEGEIAAGADGVRREGAPGKVTPGAEADRIWNGADDDGSGTTAVMAIARAFAEGPRPKRSLLFVWHVGEERGLWGSRYFADYSTVPIDRIVAQLNVDMIGRNRDDRSSERNTVYPVGSDRISRELRTINEAANAALPAPLTLDYAFDDPSDPEQLYTRSDHFSYAAKGIPVIFFTTGLHADYHANTDEVSKIEFDKMVRITQMIYATGLRVASLDHPLAHDVRR